MESVGTMNGDEGAAELPAVTDERGEAIRRRRMALGIRSTRELAIRSGVSRSATSAAEHGEGSAGTYQRLESWLADQERAQGVGQPVAAEFEQIEFVVEGDFGVRVTVKGPINDRGALEESVAKIIRSIRESSPPPSES